MNEITLLEFLVISLAVWRISSLIANEDGPFDILERFRGAIGIVYDEFNNRSGNNTFAKGVMCIWCNSMWFSFIASIFISSSLVDCLVMTLAISAMVIAIDKI